MIKVYLCGPINGCTDEECKDWRELVKTKWPDTIDPMRRDYRGKEDESVKQIVELDKIDIMNCVVVLVNYDKPSVGTSMEILYAFERGKFVVIVADHGTRISPWLRYHSHAIVGSFAAAIRFIEDVVQA
jgi:nucleoside 2-deoxyribosyltransferase